jgi:quercetin dioxygenase-like cupin family protein
VKHFREIPAKKPPTLQFRGRPVRIKGTTIRWLVNEETVGENYPYNFALRYFTMKPRGIIPLHEHAYEETLYVLKGRIKVETESEKALLKPGQYVYLGPNEPHKVANVGPGEAAFLCCISYKHAKKR